MFIFHSLKINHESHEFILDSGTVANNNLWMANRFFSVCIPQRRNFSSVVSYTATESYAVYCISLHTRFSALYPTPENNVFFVINATQKNCGMQCRKIFRVVSHNATGFLPLYPTMEEIFLRCGIQQKSFFPIVWYNERGFPPLWDTMEEFFFFVVYNGKGFFLCGIQWRKMRRMIL